MRSIPVTAGLLGGFLALAPLAAAATDAEQALLATPGKCAEARRFQGTACADCGQATRAAEDEGFDVSGSIAGRFSPADVAATAASPGPAAPTLRGFDGRGPCDTPGSCQGTVAPGPAGPTSPTGNGGVSVIERPPNPGGPPGRR
jgi:hypothetical protein